MNRIVTLVKQETIPDIPFLTPEHLSQTSPIIASLPSRSLKILLQKNLSNFSNFPRHQNYLYKHVACTQRQFLKQFQRNLHLSLHLPVHPLERFIIELVSQPSFLIPKTRQSQGMLVEMVLGIMVSEIPFTVPDPFQPCVYTEGSSNVYCGRETYSLVFVSDGKQKHVASRNISARRRAGIDGTFKKKIPRRIACPRQSCDPIKVERDIPGRREHACRGTRIVKIRARLLRILRMVIKEGLKILWLNFKSRQSSFI